MRKLFRAASALFLAVLITLSVTPIATFAADTTYNVATSEELIAAADAINAAGAGNYVINITADFTTQGAAFTVAGEKVTVIGNGHTLTMPNSNDTGFSAWNGAELNLGDGTSSLTLIGGENNDTQGTVYVIGSASVCNMYPGVTIKDHKGSNSFGGGVCVSGGKFHMYGGTIENCGIEGGSVCYGGGVAVFGSGAEFIMDGGTIKDCYVYSDYVDDYDPNRCFTAMGGGVFVTAGAEFIMNGGTIENCKATNFGGGIAEVISYNEQQSAGMGKIMSKAVINDGEIKGNKASDGAGVFISGYFYNFAAAIGTYYNPGVGNPDGPGLYINGGVIEGNEADGMGGGVLIAMVRPNTANIHNAEIKNNTANDGAGVCNFGYWTKLDIDGCTITGNAADGKGGGVETVTNSSGGETFIKNTTITGNTSGDRGAGVYYDANSKLTISGANVIKNNKYNGQDNNLNVLSLAKPVYVGGALTGSEIGLSDPTLWDDGLADNDKTALSTDYLTSGYKANNADAPENYFTSDHRTWYVDFSDVNADEVKLVRRPHEYLTKTEIEKSYVGMTGYDNAGDPVTTQDKLAEDVVVTITPYKSFNREIGKNAADIPAFDPNEYTISVGDGTDKVEVTFPDFKGAAYGIGDYWYKVVETAGSTAGVKYDENEYYLHLVVTADDEVDETNIGVSQVTIHKTAPNDDGSYTNDAADKVAGPENEYGAGELKIKKELTGNLADKNKTFEVTVTFTAPTGKTVTGPITYGASESIPANWTGAKSVTVTLGAGDEVTFSNIPDGVTYKVVEKDYSADEYDIPEYKFDNESESGDTVATGSAWAENFASGTVGDSSDTVTIKNNKDATLDVGVIIDNAPFIIIAVIALTAAALIFFRRKKEIED